MSHDSDWTHRLDVITKSAVPMLMFVCLVHADDIRNDFERMETAVTSRLTPSETKISALTLEIDQLKGKVEKLQYQCLAGWEKFGSSCYFLSTEKKTWQASNEYCHSKGADLVIITSKEEQDFVTSLSGIKSVWIGLNDRDS